MKIRREDVARTRALQPVQAVVAGTRNHFPECSAAGPELGQAGVILEADHGLGLAVERDFAGRVLHEAPRSAARFEVQDAGTFHHLAGVGDVAMAEQLQAGANGEDDGPLGNGLAQ